MIVAVVGVAGLPASSTTSPITAVAPVNPACVFAGQSVPTAPVIVFPVPAVIGVVAAAGIVAARDVSENPLDFISAEKGASGVSGTPEPRSAPRAVRIGFGAPTEVSPASRLPPNSLSCWVSKLSASLIAVSASTSPVAQAPGSRPSVTSSLTCKLDRRALRFAMPLPPFLAGPWSWPQLPVTVLRIALQPSVPNCQSDLRGRAAARGPLPRQRAGSAGTPH